MIKNLGNVNVKKLKKDALVLAIGATIGVATISVIEEEEKAKKEKAYNWAYNFINIAEYEYRESLKMGKPVTSGNVTDFMLPGNPATSGTWSIADIDNDGDLEVQLKNVEINNYIINSVVTIDEYDLDVKKR